VHYITHANAKNFQPANITFDLLPALETRIRDRQERRRRQCELGLQEFDGWMDRVGMVAAFATEAQRHKLARTRAKA